MFSTTNRTAGPQNRQKTGFTAFRNSLPVKLGRLSVLAALLLGLLFSLIQVGLDFYNEKEAIDTHVRQITGVLEKSAARAAYQLDRPQGLKVLEGLFVFPSVYRAEIIDDFGDVLVRETRYTPEEKPGVLAKMLVGDKGLRECHLRSEEEQPVGILRVWHDNNLLTRNFRSRVWLIVFSGLLRNFILAAVLTVIFHGLLSRPLMSAVAKMRMLREQDQPGESVSKTSFFPGRAARPACLVEIPQSNTDDELGELLCAMNAFIIDREASTVQVKESEKRFELAMRLVKDGLYDWNLKTDEIYYSPGWKRMLGYGEDEIKNKVSEWERLTDPDDIKNARAILDDVLQGRRSGFEVEFKMKHKDGSWVDILSRGNLVFDEDRNPVRLVGTHVDITGRKAIEKKIRESEQRFRALTASAPVGIFQTDEQGNGIYVNDIICSFTNLPAEAHSNFGWMEAIHPDDRGRVKKRWASAVSGAALFETEFRFIGKGQRITWVVSRISPLVNERGSITGYIGTLTDITDRKKAEKAQRTLQEQLRQAQKLEALGTLAGGIAHDFNNILAPLVGFSEILAQDLPDNSPLKENAEEILQAALRARDLVRQILFFSRRSDQELRSLELPPVLDEALKLLGSTIPKTIQIRTDIDPDCGTVIADPTQIHQIVMNLATNAYHAMQASGGHLTIRLKQVRVKPYQYHLSGLIPGDYALLTVADTGTGIKEELMDKIFDPYFTTKKIGKGTGLGLSVVQGIVRNYKGTVRISSEPGKGTVVDVYLPVKKKADTREQTDLSRPDKSGSEHILLVDDEAAIVKMETKILERMGYRITAKTGGSEAFEIFKSNPGQYDLIITDMTMPGMTGVQLTRKIKSIRKDIPVIICTGFSDLIDEESSKTLGIQGFVMKPVMVDELLEAVRKALDGSS